MSEIRKRTPLEEVYEEVYDPKSGLLARQDATDKTLEPIIKWGGTLKWPVRLIGLALTTYVLARLAPMLERLFGAP